MTSELKWTSVPCPVCFASANTPCDYTPGSTHAARSGRTVHHQRQYGVLNNAIQVMYDNQRQVVCPITRCGAGVGDMCKTDEVNEYGTVSHKARVQEAKKKEKESANE